ncbi:hypothetical protein D7X87_02150 [bacterium D16-54]|nr:hypothetical protein D7X87_02150 [bacterium D16-54]RKJ16456.1 hypothetical protein D7X65_02150 [bacterium D16-56]
MACLLPVEIAAEEVCPAQRKKSFEERAWFNGYGNRSFYNRYTKQKGQRPFLKDKAGDGFGSFFTLKIPSPEAI